MSAPPLRAVVRRSKAALPRLRWVAVLVVGGVALVGCSHRKPDPPPPALSGGLPPAPPGAMGARAASRVTAVPVEPTDEVPDEPPPPFLPRSHPPSIAGPDAGKGVSL